MEKEKVAILGGGASGLVASIISARRGYHTIIIEKNDRVGKKILATGNGRCNYTNLNISSYNYYGSSSNFIEKILDEFTTEKIVGFFRELGIHEYIDDTGKVYPNSLQASSILDVLRMECSYLGVEEICGTEVLEIKKEKGSFNILTEDKNYICDKVVVAVGGKASPQLCSNGSGYAILEKLGHTTKNVFPGLVQLKLKSNNLKRLSGIKIEGQITAYTGKKQLKSDAGEILFTNYGISGPPILQISRHCIEKIENGKNVYIYIDMFPKYEKNELYDLLYERFINMKYKNIRESFIGLINKGLIDTILKESKINNINESGSKFNTKEIYQIVNKLKEWKFEVLGPYFWEHAQVTAGGIDTKEIECTTMKSKKIENLYITGELMDVDGDCGGYNLHWAWSTGYIAGRSL